jgi:putative endonuclease
MQNNNYHVYILANKTNSTLYIGMTNNITRRIYEHKNHIMPGFTDKYNVTKLVYCEETHDINAAIAREKQIKKWNREWKDRLIGEGNPDWHDLYYDK